MTAQMPKAIAEAVSAIMGEVDYVQKKGENKFHNYKFAAIGDILAKLQPAMAKAGLCIVQNELAHRLSEDGAILMAEYEFLISHKTGVTWEERPRHTGLTAAKNTKGGFDDKALNKCHTAARKYFLLALFQIPTGDLPDADEQEDTDAPPPPKPATKQQQQQATRGSGNGQTRNTIPAQDDAPWKQKARTLKEQIDGATDQMVLASLMAAANARTIELPPDENGELKKVSLLEYVRQHSQAGYNVLLSTAAKKQSALAAALLLPIDPATGDSLLPEADLPERME